MTNNGTKKAFIVQGQKATKTYQIKNERGKLVFTGFSVDECKKKLSVFGLSLSGIVYAEKVNKRNAVLLKVEKPFLLLNANRKRAVLAEFSNVKDAFDYCGENGLLIVGFCGGIFGNSETDDFTPPLIMDLFAFGSRWKKPGKDVSRLFAKIAHEILSNEIHKRSLYTVLEIFEKTQTKTKKEK